MKRNMSVFSGVLYTCIPIVISAAISKIVYHLWMINIQIDAISMKETIGTILGIWGTFFGFVITAVSILIAFNGSSFTEEIRESGHYQTVIYIYIVTCAIIFVAMLIFLPIYIMGFSSEKIMMLRPSQPDLQLT